jgi:ribosome-associated translation inhibitor RaiA
MNLDIYINNEPHDDIEPFIRDRLELVVGRFHDRLSTIEIRIRDNNGSKGGIDKTCSIDAHLVPRGMLHVQATEQEMQQAVIKAIHRLESVVAKTVDRGHQSSSARHSHSGLREVTNKLEES